MLYVSTHDHKHTYTAHRALFERMAPDGGMFVPFHLPVLEQKQIMQMQTASFGQNIAQILNLFFSAQLTGWDVDFCCGRNPVNIISSPRKLLIAELWHNTAGSYDFMERALYQKLCNNGAPEQISTWARIAIRIAVYFAVFSIWFADNGADSLDVAVDDQDFVAPLAAWYARCMGLPIGVILCGCYDNGTAWDLIHRGEVNTVALRYHQGLEQLIYIALGCDETQRFLNASQNHRTYVVDEERLQMMNERLFMAVTSAERVGNLRSSFYQSSGYRLDAAAAISFGALQDFRARVGESRITMLFSLRDPRKHESNPGS